MGLFIRGADPGTGGTKEGDNLEFTSAGAARIEEVGTQFRAYLTTQVSLNARRRGALAADNTDVDEAYRLLLSRRVRPLIVDIFSEIGLVVAGALVGYATTLLTQEKPSAGPGIALLFAGLFLGLLCAVLKHIELQG